MMHSGASFTRSPGAGLAGGPAHSSMLTFPAALAVLWLMYLVGKPFYIFEPRNPQPADMLMAALIGITISGLCIRVPVHRNLYLLGCITLTWFFTVNITYFGMSVGDHQFPPHTFFKSSLYYVYNFGIVMVIIALCADRPDRFVRLTRVGLLVTVIIELISVIDGRSVDEWGRSLGTFASNNQFGEWAMITTACWLVLRGNDGLRPIDLSVLAALTYVCLHSGSKAAVAAQVLLVIGGIAFHRLARGRALVATAATALLVLSLGLPQLYNMQEQFERAEEQTTIARMAKRYEDVGKENDSSLLGRGYVRIWRHPEYLFFGAGEGGYGRFSETGHRYIIEIHSSLGTVLFCYGILGLTLFLTLLWTILRHAPWKHWFYFAAVSSYGITHQGLRFSPFWVLLGLIFAMAHYSKPRAAVPTVTGDR